MDGRSEKYAELLERIDRLEAQIRSEQSDDLSDEEARALAQRIAALEAGRGGGARRAAGKDGARSSKALHQCRQPPVPKRIFAPGVSLDRARLIATVSKKWVNGTILRYAFMPEASPIGGDPQKKLVREGFARWAGLGIGITFKEVASIADAQVRIGFVEGDGSWSYVGRDVRDIPGKTERTMNFGWDLTQDPRTVDVAVHEIGHTLGFEHEHQNPFSGIVWDEPEVIRYFAGDPNFWDEATTRHNILDKLLKSQVSGTVWDPNSIMHYAFDRGLILKPDDYRNGLTPAGGLSPRDIAQVKLFYPPISDDKNQELRPLRSQMLRLEPAEQVSFNVVPAATKDYTFQTYGNGDTVLVLFEDRGNGDLHAIKGDDDSGVERSSSITTRLIAGQHYVLRVRLFANPEGNELAVMMSDGLSGAQGHRRD